MPYHHTPELRAPEVLQHTQELLEEKLPWKADGYKCTTDDLFKVLVGVAATRSTLDAVCVELGGTPDPPTVRGYFNEQLRVEDECIKKSGITQPGQLPPSENLDTSDGKWRIARCSGS